MSQQSRKAKPSDQLELDLPPGADKGPDRCLDAPSGLALGGNPGICSSCGRGGDGFHLGKCPCDGVGPAEVRVVNGRVWRLPVPDRRA